MGLVGIICYLGMFAVALWSAKKRTWLLMALLGYMTIAFFSACRERPFASLMMMVFIAIACRRRYTIGVRKEVLILLTLCLVVFGFHYRASCWNKKLRNVQEYEAVIEHARGYSIFTTLTYTGIPWHWWSGMAHYKRGNKEVALNHFNLAYKYNPANVHTLNAIGIVSAELGDKKQAKKYFKEAIRICPTFIDAQLNLGKLRK